MCCRVSHVARVVVPGCRDASLLRCARDLDERDRRVAALEGELAALRKALDDCQTRHTDQLARYVRLCVEWAHHILGASMKRAGQ